MTIFLRTLNHGRKWSPFHPFRGRGWRRSQNGVGHKMRREKKKGKKKKKRGKRKKEERKRARVLWTRGKRRPRASNGQRYPLPCRTHFGNLKYLALLLQKLSSIEGNSCSRVYRVLEYKKSIAIYPLKWYFIKRRRINPRLINLPAK